MEYVQLIQNNDLDEMENLLENKIADISVNGQTLLVYAIQSNKVEMVRLLLEFGANPNSYDLPLSVAVMNDNPEIVQLLLDYGADKSIPDKDGLLPIDYYNRFIEPNEEIQKMLR
jgi:ankyrin repeat protein